MKAIFQLVDSDHSNRIDSNELATLLHTVGMPADDRRVSATKCLLRFSDILVNRQVRVIMDEVDRDLSGTVDFEEFLKIMRRPTITKYSSHDIKNAFITLHSAVSGECDQTPEGNVHVNTLKLALRSYPTTPLTDLETQEICDLFGPNEDGYVNYQRILDLIDRIRPGCCAKESHIEEVHGPD
ncbi:hypothetical protein CTAYLR_001232 [Chrysophaeum taylorii]|uniref:EF-hand domain-containing protein n=1 Tax=Chrysophaeum taylorii TaxID=2483200 RepID=A0AAD7XK77_9STRA|nr:hypothetical protein CTAYLR_001232 [Chrysophaeum taylorii]